MGHVWVVLDQRSDLQLHLPPAAPKIHLRSFHQSSQGALVPYDASTTPMGHSLFHGKRRPVPRRSTSRIRLSRAAAWVRWSARGSTNGCSGELQSPGIDSFPSATWQTITHASPSCDPTFCHSYIKIASEEGARLVTGGGRPAGVGDRGYFIAPTVFADVKPTMRIWKEEVFGPVSILRRGTSTLTIEPLEDP